ncbi:hypothetical protein [Mycobacterium sp. 29Ha]|uniref:hypothetical protein n=1 Tax=Mycobacterium sp. 29Ha TaxID=2939268 RepID=UPI002938FE47|nr:hypothetical protein [Mycobacterium sp. 29Ha]MDV3131694.1 hypothetical protein [Mycobacterium sp. 29Ha]
MRLDRRWWLAIGVAVVVAVVLVLSNTVFKGPSEECKPVQAFLDYNKSQGELIASKESDSDPAVPTVAEDAAYQQWADGMAQRAQNINDPNLAATAIQVADAASKFVAMLPRARAESENHAPGAPAPPSFFEMTLLNKRIGDGLSQLADACS